MRIQLPYIHGLSFWLGFILASILWLILSALKPVFQQLRETLLSKRDEARAKTRHVNEVEDHYRRLVLKRAQGMHLSASLFSLDEIVIKPLLLAPPPRVEPGNVIPLEDAVSLSIPYLPAWPDLSAVYQTETLTLAQALSGNSDVVLTGQPGSGKTVALSHLASILARKDPLPELPGVIPFLVHVADLDLTIRKTDDPLGPLIDSISEQSSLFEHARIPEFTRNVFAESRALLMIDGTDELTPSALGEIIKFIKAVKKSYPRTRIVTTANPEYLDGLVSLNFIPMYLAAWTLEQRLQFLEIWGALWERYITVETWAQSSLEHVDPLILNRWLISETAALTPLELTLSAWAAYAGDLCGASPIDGIEAHIRRVTPSATPKEALEMLSLQIHLAVEPIFDPRKARDWVRSFEPPGETIDPEEKSDKPKKKHAKQEKVVAPSLGLISKLAESGLLSQHKNNRMRFTHPVFGGFLAGKILGNYKPQSILEQPPWPGKFLALHYFAAHQDATAVVETLLSQPDRPFERNLLIAARWLRDSRRNDPWRGKVFTRLAELLHGEGQPINLRGQALAALIASRDPVVAALFRQGYQGKSSELLQLSALGSGAFMDTKAVDDLLGLLSHPSPNVGRAACLALVKIGVSSAIDGVASALLHGNESLQRAASEALAYHLAEGHSILSEGSEVDDILVRRAVTYGLGRIPQIWAQELLLKMQVEDKEWIVRAAASEVLESKNRPNPHIPRRLPVPSESPWLIEFAGKQGLGISPDKPPTDLLLNALKSGNEEERLAAMPYLRMYPNEGVFASLFQSMYSGDPGLQEMAFLTLSEMSARGIQLPDPVQYGVG